MNWKHPKKTHLHHDAGADHGRRRTSRPVRSPEKGGNALDSLSDRPMYQLQLATDGTLWFDH